MNDTASSTGHNHSFQAEVDQLLKLMVHSVYSNKDIFLRELISNAADACEKLRYLSVQDASLINDDPAFGIALHADEAGKQLTISDNGIGMTREELIDNLGTIAKSGTKAFLSALSEKEDKSQLIGQFGVGFYSAFMVASQVDVVSCKAGSNDVFMWSSDGEGTFSVTSYEEDDAPKRGTRIVMHLNEESLSYCEPATVERIVRAYSSHVPIPIHLFGLEKDEEGEDKPFDRALSDGSALWVKSKSEISSEEYKDFYQLVSGNFDEPAKTMHYRVEGRQEYTVLAFLPSAKPFDLFDRERAGRMKLYVRRVFITDDVQIMPSWLRFVRGVVDSEDLPLNISRELLQDNPLLDAIGTAVTKRVLSELGKMAEKEAEAYSAFWAEFGAVIKEGLYEDYARRDDIYKICRFKSSRSGDELIALDTYLERMKENQTAIYYVLGDNIEALAVSPQLEGYKERDVEVLYLTDPVDAFWVRTSMGYDGKPFKSITQGGDDLAAIDVASGKQDENKSAETDVIALSSFLKDVLGDAVSDVRASSRLASSAVCFVASEGALDKQLEKILKSQPGEAPSSSAPIMEINPSHGLVSKLASAVEAEGDKSKAERIAWLLHGQARILDGEAPIDPARFSKLMSELMEGSL